MRTVIPFHVVQPARDWKIENPLMKRLHDFFESFGDYEAMKKFGPIWRWRIRMNGYANVYAVEKALDLADAERKTLRCPGGFLNREWKMALQKLATARAQAAE